MAEFHNAPEIRQNEALPPKGVSKETPEKKEHPGTQAALAFVEKNFWDLPDEDKKDMKVAESTAFLGANPGAADLFARVIKHCEANGAWSKLAGECQDGLPISVSDISKLAEKFEIAQAAEIVTKTGEEKSEAAKEKSEAAKEKSEAAKEKSEAAKEKSDRINSIRERLSQYGDLASKYESQLADLEKGDFDPTDPKVHEFAKNLLSDFQSKIKSLAESGQDTSKAAEDLKFFATQFRDLGVIDHAEWRRITEEAVKTKEFPGSKDAPKDGRTALAENFSSAWDGRTYFALGRRDGDNRLFDEFVRVSPDGKSASKEIVGKYGYSLTLEPLPLETAKSAERESKRTELAEAQSGKSKIENQARFVDETFGRDGSKIPSPEDPQFKEFKDAADAMAKETGALPDPQDPKKTLENVRTALKDSYLKAVEKTSKTQKELSELEKDTLASVDESNAKREKDARDAIDFLDRTGISAISPKATEELLKKFGAAGCENGKPANLEKFLKDKNALASEFRAFVTGALGREESALFNLEEVPPSMKPLFDQAGRPVELKSAFAEKGLVSDDGRLNLEKASAPKTETQTA